MKAALHQFHDTLISLIERHPSVGYIGAATPTTAGLWVLLQQATAIGGLLSIIIGIAVGIITLRVQWRQLKRKD